MLPGGALAGTATRTSSVTLQVWHAAQCRRIQDDLYGRFKPLYPVKLKGYDVVEPLTPTSDRTTETGENDDS